MGWFDVSRSVRPPLTSFIWVSHGNAVGKRQAVQCCLCQVLMCAGSVGNNCVTPG